MFRHRRRLCAEIKPKQPKKARQKVCCHFDILFIEIRALLTAWITKLASYYLGRPPTRPAPVRILLLMHKTFFSEILTQKT